MSIFTKSNGENSTATSYSVGSVSKIIPDGTKVLCNVISVDETDNSPLNKDYEKQGESYLRIGILVVEGEYRGVELSQKLYINANDYKIKDNAIDLLTVYNNISGGKIEKTTASLSHLNQLTDKLLSRNIVGLELTATAGLIGSEYIDSNGNKSIGNKYIDEKTGEIKFRRSLNFVRGIEEASKKIPEGEIRIISREPGEDDDLGDEDIF